jgi:SAM-dependent methyltransferase
MSKTEAYDVNLEQRLAELRHGDPAYELHGSAVIEAIAFARILRASVKGTERILDAGCGLGFLAARLSHTKELGEPVSVGIDPSEKAIALAKTEHSGVRFYQSSAETFSDLMPIVDEKPFDFAIINMVLHAVDNKTALEILRGVKNCLNPLGGAILVIPGPNWLKEKLLEYALDSEMAETRRAAWVNDMLSQPEVELPVKVRGGQYYPQPLTIFNRKPEDYGYLLESAHFGLCFFGEDISKSQYIPYWEPRDFLHNYELFKRTRSLLLSFVIPDTKVD